jgi:2-polyprenyl-3-methyl-5-hydroxy-6-metoxy-1,4-benzoquinol methylase
LARQSWNRNVHYHRVVLGAVPRDCRRALDVGCGTGMLARRLAACCSDVVGIDANAPALARARAAHVLSNVKFIEGDAMTHAFDEASFDLIASIATLHHLPLEPALERFKQLLRPGGTLAVIGLYRMSTLSDLVYAHAAMPVSWWYRCTRPVEPVAAPIRDPDETLSEIQCAAKRILPGADVTRQLLFRYSLVWRKTSGRVA